MPQLSKHTPVGNRLRPNVSVTSGRAAPGIFSTGQTGISPEAAPPAKPLKILYLLTTFPLLSETFVKREVRALSRLPVELDIVSLWGGAAEFEGRRIRLFPKRKMISLLWWLPFWVMKKPRAFARLLQGLVERKPASAGDFGATLLGIAFALSHARHFSKEDFRPELIHAGWATMPATAAQFLHALIGVPFSFQAHAFDIFRDGGDWLLPAKLKDADLVITSTDYARDALIARGAPASKVVMIRRGLALSSPPRPSRSPRSPLRLLSIGRLVEKKGFRRQLEILAGLKAAGFRFESRIIGGGPLEKDLRAIVAAFGLEREVLLTGPKPHGACRKQFRWADVFLFTGEVAPDGDRDGLPNVVCEAMAFGVPVVATPVAGVPEAIRDGETGVIVSASDADEWRSALARLRDDEEFYRRIRDAAWAWIRENFDIDVNARLLAYCFHSTAKKSGSGLAQGIAQATGVSLMHNSAGHPLIRPIEQDLDARGHLR